MRDPLVFSYLIACGYSPYRAKRHYHAFAQSIGLARPHDHVVVPASPPLPLVLTAMRDLDRHPTRITLDEHERACGAVTHAQRALRACTKARYPTTYRAERRKAARALHHALAYRDAVAYALNETAPTSIVKRRTAHCKPGTAQKLATLRYSLRNAQRRETELVLAYEEARKVVAHHQSTYDSINANLYLVREESEHTLAKRRLDDPNARRARGSGAAVKGLAARLRAARGGLKAVQFALARHRAHLTKVRERIARIEKNISDVLTFD